MLLVLALIVLVPVLIGVWSLGFCVITRAFNRAYKSNKTDLVFPEEIFPQEIC